jgi:hypothetical protein
VTLALATYSGAGGAPLSNGAPASSSNSTAGQVVITGAIDKTYAPVSVEASPLIDKIVVNVNDETVGGVSIQFPADTPPGTYPIADCVNNAVCDIFADYVHFQDGGGLSSSTYRSLKGTLTLTAAGTSFSGSFTFTAANLADHSKTIDVSGSFTGASLQQ